MNYMNFANDYLLAPVKLEISHDHGHDMVKPLW